MLQVETSPETSFHWTLKLITAGRLTGLPHIAELRYIRQDGSFFVLAGNAKSDWLLNSLAAGVASVKIGDTVWRVAPRIVSNAERLDALEGFKRKYGLAVVDEWYKGAHVCIQLVPLERPTVRGAVRGETETQTNLAQWRQKGVEYYQSIQEAFDSASEEYDFTISRNYINSWIRKRSIRELFKLVQPSDVLLEIGCGTGAEAIKISKRVAGIVATDISDKMLVILDRKLLAKKLDRKIIALKFKASEISGVERFLPEGKVRLAYSFNGALNCEPQIQRVPEEIARVLEDKGYFVCSIRNTLCLPELMSHSMVLQFDKAQNRKKQPMMVSVGGIDIPSFYYSPETFSRIFQPYFRIRKIIGLPAFLPPAYLNDYYLKTGLARHFLEKLELALGGSFPFNRFGDQTLFVFQKR